MKLYKVTLLADEREELERKKITFNLRSACSIFREMAKHAAEDASLFRPCMIESNEMLYRRLSKVLRFTGKAVPP